MDFIAIVLRNKKIIINLINSTVLRNKNNTNGNLKLRTFLVMISDTYSQFVSLIEDSSSDTAFRYSKRTYIWALTSTENPSCYIQGVGRILPSPHQYYTPCYSIYVDIRHGVQHFGGMKKVSTLSSRQNATNFISKTELYF